MTHNEMAGTYEYILLFNVILGWKHEIITGRIIAAVN
jgi:hypothetical protein